MSILGIRPVPSGSGAAFWSPDGASGVVFARPGNKGDRGAALTCFRNALFAWFGPGSGHDVEHVVICKWSGGEASEAYDAQVEMIGTARQICEQFSIPFTVVGKSSALKEVAGASRAPKDQPASWLTKRLRDGCRSRGFDPKSDVIAEAYAAVALYRAGLHLEHPWASAGPLFNTAA